jgi:FRG domain
VEFIKKKTLIDDQFKGKKLITNLHEMMGELKALQNESYIFRGQPNSNFTLHPKAFRPEEIEKIRKDFSISLENCSDAFKKNISGWLGQPFEQLHTNEWFRRIYEITLFIMQYSRNIANYILPRKEKFDKRTIDLHTLNPPEYWASISTLERFLDYNLKNLIAFTDLNGNVLKYTSIDDILTGFDESRSQHYGVQTAMLDWTLNPSIAIFFALQNIPDNAQYVSIYAYKQIRDSKENPIVIKSSPEEVENTRIINQEGVFTCIQYPCSFYFVRKHWPRIDDYFAHSSENFKLIKYDIPLSYNQHLDNIVKVEGYTRDFLLPEE